MYGILFHVVLLSAALVFSACGLEDDWGFEVKNLGLQPTFDSIHDDLLAQSCAASGCHGGDDPYNGLALDQGADAVYAQLMEASEREPLMNLVEPGEPANSALYRALTGTGGFQPMPPTGQIAGEDMDAVWDWIEAGAPR